MLSSNAVKQAALESRFSLVGLAPAEPLDPEPLRTWLGRGFQASMSWMARRLEERLDPARLLPGCRTVVALGCCLRTAAHRRASPIALYARGRDYHATLRDRLRELRRRLLALAPALGTYACVDTGPVMEKVWAQRAGLGWLGKNGLLLTREHGSHVLLAVLLLDQPCDTYDVPGREHCGRCSACLERCPTRAIVSPGVVDSRACLSHQTIEDRDAPYAPALRPAAAGLAFGCDHCQIVCPWNDPWHACEDDRFLPRAIAGLSLRELATLPEARFRELTRGTAVARARYDGLRRNALVALGAEGRAAGDPALEPLAKDPCAWVADAARWALAQAPRR